MTMPPTGCFAFGLFRDRRQSKVQNSLRSRNIAQVLNDSISRFAILLFRSLKGKSVLGVLVMDFNWLIELLQKNNLTFLLVTIAFFKKIWPFSMFLNSGFNDFV